MPPVLNPYTRVAVEMCPQAGILRVLGYERGADGELPAPVTQVCEVAAADDGRRTTEDGLINA